MYVLYDELPLNYLTQILGRALTKNTPMPILFKIVQGFQKNILLVYQTSPGMGIIF